MLENNIRLLIEACSATNFLPPQILNIDKFWIIDQAFKVEFSQNHQKNWLKVKNIRQEGFVFIRIDGDSSVFGSKPPRINNLEKFIYNHQTNERAGACDCLILDSVKWHFMEFKIESYTESRDQIEENRTKAELQIARTITFFKENTNSFNVPMKAVIITPRQYSYPRFKSNRSRAVIFKLKWNTDLIEVNLPHDSYEINT